MRRCTALPHVARAHRTQALCDLEANSNDLKAELRELYITSAKEVDVTGRKAVVIFVPFKLLKVVHKIQSRLVREVRVHPLAAHRYGRWREGAPAWKGLMARGEAVARMELCGTRGGGCGI